MTNGVHDCFDSLITKNTFISVIQKFHYLKSSICKNVSKVFLPVSTNNCILTWKLICECFNNKNNLLHSHIKVIFALPKSGKENFAQRQLMAGFSSNLCSLETLGEPIEHWQTNGRIVKRLSLLC